MHSDNFANKVITITGAASGFGRLLATRLARQGARLVLSDLNIDALEQFATSLRDSGCELVTRRCDVTREQEVREFTDAAVEAFGQLDIAVNNAGMATPMKSLIDTTEQDIDLNYAVNTKGVFFGIKFAIQHMLRQGNGGIILNVASMAGLGGAPKLTAYCAAKHAVVGISKTAALEYAKHNIRVNAICPYYSPTPLVTEGIDPSVRDMLAGGSPMKRLGEPEEIVEAMLMLIAPENSYLTGQAIAIDGGVSAR